MSRTGLDTNVVLRLVLNDVPEHAKAAARVVGLSPCYITDVVVAECVFVLEKVYKFDRRAIFDSLMNLFDLNTLSFNEAVITKAFDLYLSSRSLSFADCYSVAEAELGGNQLLTFDQAILKKCGPTAYQPK